MRMAPMAGEAKSGVERLMTGQTPVGFLGVPWPAVGRCPSRYEKLAVPDPTT